MSKNNQKPAPATQSPDAPGQGQQAPRVSVMTFVTIAFINNTTAIKVPVDNVDTGKKILDEVEAVLRTGGVYFNKDRGIMFKTTELSHAFLGMERVAQ